MLASLVYNHSKMVILPKLQKSIVVFYIYNEIGKFCCPYSEFHALRRLLTRSAR